MKILKKYKWIILGFFILFAVILVWICKDLFFAQEGALYGNRLEGIENYPISNDVKKSVTDYLLSVEGIEKVDTNIHGKIISIVILVDEAITVDKVKEASSEALKKFTADQLGFYDVSLLVDYANDSKKTDFPINGSKSKNSDVIVW
jgi:hypothetical protein